MAINVQSLRELSVPTSQYFEPDEAPATVLGTGATNTISSGPDDGSINKLAGLFWKPLRHKTIQEVRQNLSLPRRDVFPQPQPGQTETRDQNIAGHGNTGYMEVGAGQGGGGSEYVGRRNQDHWGWPLALGGQDWDGLLTFWSCSTGGGRGGAQLLFQVAKATSRTVRARTGLLLVVTQGNRRWVEYEQNSTWQQADPGMAEPPPPIDPPSLAPEKLMPSALASFISPDDVSTIELDRWDEDGWSSTSVAGAASGALIAALFHSLPFPREGYVPGIETVRAKFIMIDGGVHEVVVLADRLTDFPEAGLRFMASPELDDIIRGLAA